MPAESQNGEIALIWGGPPPPPTLGYLNRRGNKWWEQYANSIASHERRAELESSSCATVEVLPDPIAWAPNDSPFKGLVVGAVQSGKTASMIGVASVALDQGYQIVVVLAGQRDDLRRQTARRFNTQLLLQSDIIPGSSGLTTLGATEGPGPLGGFALPYYYDVNLVPTVAVQMQRTLALGQPCVLVVKKNPASLQALGAALRSVYRRGGIDKLPTLILDDECDEASISGPGDDPSIPTGISGLWERNIPAPLVAYVGYTATAAAALLQDPSNSLFPTHFVRLLKFPAGQEGPLSYAYPEPDGWYTGGAAFYTDLDDEPGEENNFLVSPSIDAQELLNDPRQNESLYEALIAYFISGAFRLALQPGCGFGDGDLIPRAHSMMIQTSTSRDDHRVWRDAIRDGLEGIDSNGLVRFLPDKLMQRLEKEESRWRTWYERFNHSRVRLHERRPHPEPFQTISWDRVVELLPSVFSNTRLKVVNSDEDGQSLDYASGVTASGVSLPPNDIYVIAIGGSKLSRGLTVEGLCTSYYSRSSSKPHEDTTLQTSRWFGYRGAYFEFCRLFTTFDTYERLLNIHQNDIDHRMRLAELMERRETVDQARLALRVSPTCLLTGKMGIGKTADLAFSPFTHVFSFVETGDLAQDNELAALQIVNKVRERAGKEILSSMGLVRGILSKGWEAEEVSDLLDSLRYSGHNPDASAYPMSSLYKPTERNRPVGRLLSTDEDPYVIAAYLRYWMREGQNSPRFNVGITFGSIVNNTEPFGFPLLNRLVSVTGHLEGGWSGSSGNWRGDQYFDDVPDSLTTSLGQRKSGASGLLLLHLVHREARGRSGHGIQRKFHTPTYGVAIPDGGPPFSVVVNYRI